LRVPLGGMADAADGDGDGRRQRAALGPTGLTPVKSKRAAPNGDDSEGGTIAAEPEPGADAGASAMEADAPGGGAAAASGSSHEAAGAEGNCVAVGTGTFVHLYIRIFAVLCVRASVPSVLR
jgi:hypothetical protein